MPPSDREVANGRPPPISGTAPVPPADEGQGMRQPAAEVTTEAFYAERARFGKSPANRLL